MTKFIVKYSDAVQVVCAVSFGFAVTMFGWKSYVLFMTFLKWLHG